MHPMIGSSISRHGCLKGFLDKLDELMSIYILTSKYIFDLDGIFSCNPCLFVIVC